MIGYLRPVKPEDMDLLYEWVNEEETRKNAFHSEPIPYENHVKWFHNILQSDQVLQYLYIYNEEPIGQVRLNLNENSALIDYSISKPHRGQGHGKHILRLAEDTVKMNYPVIKRLVAQVKTENIASQKVIEDLNYRKSFIEFTKEL